MHPLLNSHFALLLLMSLLLIAWIGCYTAARSLRARQWQHWISILALPCGIVLAAWGDRTVLSHWLWLGADWWWVELGLLISLLAGTIAALSARLSRQNFTQPVTIVWRAYVASLLLLVVAGWLGSYTPWSATAGLCFVMIVTTAALAWRWPKLLWIVVGSGAAIGLLSLVLAWSAPSLFTNLATYAVIGAAPRLAIPLQTLAILTIAGLSLPAVGRWWLNQSRIA